MLNFVTSLPTIGSLKELLSKLYIIINVIPNIIINIVCIVRYLFFVLLCFVFSVRVLACTSFKLFLASFALLCINCLNI